MKIPKWQHELARYYKRGKLVSYFLNNAAKTCLYGLKISENIEIWHFFQSRTFFHLSSNLHTSFLSAFKLWLKLSILLHVYFSCDVSFESLIYLTLQDFHFFKCLGLKIVMQKRKNNASEKVSLRVGAPRKKNNLQWFKIIYNNFICLRIRWRLPKIL